MGSLSRSVFVVAGEASGDLHLSKLIRALKMKNPHVRFWGIGGPRMQEAGVDITFNAADLGVVGLSEVWDGLKTIRQALNQSAEEIRRRRPDAVLLVDYPDFNLRLAKKVHELGIPVIYYISPQIWAWRSGRIRTMKKIVRKMMVIFPFEEKLYRDAGIDVSYVGHPLLDELKEQTIDFDPEEFKRSIGLSASDRVVTLMPGSRRSEIRHHLELFLATAQEIHVSHPDVRFVLPLAPTLDRASILSALGDAASWITLTTENATRVLAASECAVIASGTSTLQAALLGIPMVIVYRVAPLGYWLYRKVLSRCPFVGLPNIVAGKEIVPELIQDRFQPTEVAARISQFLTDSATVTKTVRELRHVREKLELAVGMDSESSASLRAANEVAKILGLNVIQLPPRIVAQPRLSSKHRDVEAPESL